MFLFNDPLFSGKSPTSGREAYPNPKIDNRLKTCSVFCKIITFTVRDYREFNHKCEEWVFLKQPTPWEAKLCAVKRERLGKETLVDVITWKKREPQSYFAGLSSLEGREILTETEATAEELEKLFRLANAGEICFRKQSPSKLSLIEIINNQMNEMNQMEINALAYHSNYYNREYEF